MYRNYSKTFENPTYTVSAVSEINDLEFQSVDISQQPNI
jgi:hypothetical protein